MKQSFADREGMGESYRIKAQIRLLNLLKCKHGFSVINEFPSDPISKTFPGELNWISVDHPASPGEMCFTWRAFPVVSKLIAEQFPGQYVLLMGTNYINPGVLFQKLYGKTKEYYSRIKDLMVQLNSLGFNVIDKGYYDSPPWFDVNLPFNGHVGVNAGGFRLLEIFEEMPGKSLRAHHIWALGKRIIGWRNVAC